MTPQERQTLRDAVRNAQGIREQIRAIADWDAQAMRPDLPVVQDSDPGPTRTRKLESDYRNGLGIPARSTDYRLASGYRTMMIKAGYEDLTPQPRRVHRQRWVAFGERNETRPREVAMRKPSKLKSKPEPPDMRRPKPRQPRLPVMPLPPSPVMLSPSHQTTEIVALRERIALLRDLAWALVVDALRYVDGHYTPEEQAVLIRAWRDIHGQQRSRLAGSIGPYGSLDLGP